MSSANVLPTAPEYEVTSTQNLYPQLSLQPDFRLQKISEISTALNNDCLVAKQYKRAKKIVNWGADGSSSLSEPFQAQVLAQFCLWWAYRLQFL